MQRLILFFIFLGCLAVPNFAAEDAHVHGKASLDIVLEEGVAQLILKLPADSAVGFEHRPSTKAENRLIQKAKDQLANKSLFKLYKSSRIFRSKKEIAPIGIHQEVRYTFDDNHNDKDDNHDEHDHHEDHEEHEDHSHDHDHDAAHSDGHSEFEVTAVFSLPKNVAIASISTQLFNLFEGLEHIDLTFVSDNGSQVIDWPSTTSTVSFKEG